MTDVLTQTDSTQKNPATAPTQKRLRMWPAILALVVLGLARVWAFVGEMAPHKFFFGLVITPAIVSIFLVLWWLFGSRLRWSDRLVGAGLLLATAAATVAIAGKNFPAMALIMYALPILAVLWVGWLILTMGLSWPIRRAGVYLIFIGCGVVCSALRVDGMDGSFKAAIHWRWTPTAEAQLLSEMKSSSTTSAAPAETAPDLTLHDGDWSSFRGAARDGRLSGVSIQTDWDKTPPREVWRHRVGPAWSSCTVIGNRLFTQEQRGEEELVVCYDADTGKEVWAHHDKARFEEVVAGAGPRGTPSFHEGRIYAQGAAGRLNCLNAATGKLYWTVDIMKDSKAELPQWGFSSSPLVSNGLVSVFAGGADGKSVVAYKIENGEFAWGAGDGSEKGAGLKSYCSTQLTTIDGTEQILIATSVGLTSFDPATGTVLWEHQWQSEQPRCVQPTIVNDTDVLLGTGMSGGTRRLHVERKDDKWKVEEQWTSKSIKPYYNDLVVYKDHLYGFDGNVFMCVSLEKKGKIEWRARGYGNGQVLLLVDQGLLVISTEQGEVALVNANPEEHQEVARFKAIEGKTWNHPVIAHGKLYIRNAEEMACFTLALKEDTRQASVDASDIESADLDPRESK